MKVQLLKNDIKETFGEGDASFDYWYRPLTVDEKQRIRSSIVWMASGKSYTVDFAKTDPGELVRLAVTKIDRLFDSDDKKIATIGDLLDSTLAPGELDGILISMWTTIWLGQVVPEALKKKS